MMRYVLTGAPGAGKTSILDVLATRGYDVVGEAATAVIADAAARGVDEPWTQDWFVDEIVVRQRDARQAACQTDVQLFDRSPVCTLALAQYLGRPVSATLAQEIDRIAREQTYERRVFFVRPLGFIEPTAARRISYEESLEFGQVHEDTYLRLGYELVDIVPGPVEDRADAVERGLLWR